MSDRVLVTGAAGFIESHICRRPVADGIEVVGLDDLSDGSAEYLFTYVDDVVEATVLAARASVDAFGSAYNIGGGGLPTSVNQRVALIAREVGVEPDPVHEPARPGDVRLTRADVSLARDRLGHEPTVDIADGIRRTVASFRGVPA